MVAPGRFPVSVDGRVNMAAGVDAKTYNLLGAEGCI